MKSIISFLIIIVMCLTVIGFKTFSGIYGNREDVNVINAKAIEKKDTSNNDKLNYQIIRKVSEDTVRNTSIFYPQIVNYHGELLMDYMNQSLKKIVNLYEKKDTYSDINIDYKITKMNENIISVLYQGSGKLFNGKNITIQHSINLYIKSTNEIVFNNFIKNDQISRDKFIAILGEKYKAKGIKSLPEAESMRIYFEGENVNFYYMIPDDSATKFVEITVPIKELEGLINMDFGNRPAS